MGGNLDPSQPDQSGLTRRLDLYDHLSGPKTLLTFTAEEGADAHCHVGAERLLTGRVYDWLGTALSRTGTP